MFRSMSFDNAKKYELQFKFHFVRFVIQIDFSPVIEHKEFENYDLKTSKYMNFVNFSPFVLVKSSTNDWLLNVIFVI